MRRIVLAFAALTAVLTAPARADLIHPVAVSGMGDYGNSPDLIIDGSVPPRNTYYAADTNVYWFQLATAFTVDLGGAYTVTDLTVAVDNNDDYLVEYSEDGVTFTDLFTFLASDGPVTVGAGGLDILTTDSSFPASPSDNTTPAYVGRVFTPVEARYLRISAVGGDDYYAIGEIQAYGSRVQAVPEPASFTLLGIGAAGLIVRGRRRRGSAGRD